MFRKISGFTANHATIMFVAAMVAIMPGSLWAVATYQNVAIQDFKSGKLATVNKQRQLAVYDNWGAADEQPANFVRFTGFTSTACVPLASAPAGKALVIKSITFDVYAQSAPGASYVELWTGVSGCSSLVGYMDAASNGVNQLNFEPGLVVPAGQSLWHFQSSPGLSYVLFGTGYLVPAAWAPAAAAYDVSGTPASKAARRR